MKSIATFILFVLLGLSTSAQTTIANGGFETWGNSSPGISSEPTGWYSNKSGSTTAQLANPTCFQESSIVHSGNYSVKVQTITYLGIEVVNGVVTTGVVNAPSTNKDSGYIGTVNYSNASDDRRMPFTGRPDSLVGWYQYVSGGTGEQAKIRAILHTGDYYDPETPTNSYHPNPVANKIADVTFLGPMSSVSTWTRFSLPFTYVSGSNPAYIMINVTPSANQGTTVSGSILYLDDLQVVYNTTSGCTAPTGLASSSITSSSAVLNWTASGALGSQYVVNTIATDPTTSGTATTGTTYTATGLTANTLYYAHVRDSCGASSLSAWATTSFTTLHAAGVNNVIHGDFGISAFPNPVSDELTIKISGAAGLTGELQLMDISGKLIRSVVADAATININLNGLPSGVYAIRYVDAVHTQTIKVTKQ